MPCPPPDRADHYFSPAPGVASAPRQVELVLPEGHLIRLATDRGVFSADHVDVGTRILLVEGPPVAAGPAVLVDVGCGYGAVAITLALRSHPEATVWAVDVNERARGLCRTNARANGVGEKVRVVAPEDVPDGLLVDQIWSNPPIRVGKVSLHDLLTTWLDRLRRPDGHASLVVHKHLGADSLATWLTTEGWATERLVSRAGYRVLTVSARTTPDPHEPGGERRALAPDSPPSSRGSRDPSSAP
ncbi:MAG: class I SAM-dependent methyltransferase [Acidimicrobiales bacterium]